MVFSKPNFVVHAMLIAGLLTFGCTGGSSSSSPGTVSGSSASSPAAFDWSSPDEGATIGVSDTVTVSSTGVITSMVATHDYSPIAATTGNLPVAIAGNTATIKPPSGGWPEGQNTVSFTGTARDESDSSTNAQTSSFSGTIRFVTTKGAASPVTPTLCSSTSFLTSNGKIIYFEEDGTNTRNLYSINIDGTERTKLTFLTNKIAQSPNRDFPDNRITYISNEDGDFEIKRMDDDGSNTCQVTTNFSVNGSGSWDGTHVYYNGAPLAVYRSDLNGDNEVMLVGNNSAQNGAPNACPDGRVVYVSDASGRPEIYKMNSDGTGQAKLTNLSGIIGGVRCCTNSTGDTKGYFSRAGTNYSVDLDTMALISFGAGSEPDPASDCSAIVYMSGGEVYHRTLAGVITKVTTGGGLKGAPTL